LASTRVTPSLGSSFFSQRAHVAPAKPPPTTTTLAAPCAETTDGARGDARLAAAVSFRKVRRPVMLLYLGCAASHWQIASISGSLKPLAMRPITVAGRAPLLNSRIWFAVSAAGRPLTGGTMTAEEAAGA